MVRPDGTPVPDMRHVTPTRHATATGTTLSWGDSADVIPLQNCDMTAHNGETCIDGLPTLLNGGTITVTFTSIPMTPLDEDAGVARTIWLPPDLHAAVQDEDIVQGHYLCEQCFDAMTDDVLLAAESPTGLDMAQCARCRMQGEA